MAKLNTIHIKSLEHADAMRQSGHKFQGATLNQLTPNSGSWNPKNTIAWFHQTNTRKHNGVEIKRPYVVSHPSGKITPPEGVEIKKEIYEDVPTNNTGNVAGFCISGGGIAMFSPLMSFKAFAKKRKRSKT